MNQNIENHNKKFQVGKIIQGAKILDILKYSKNGKSIEFLFECPICHEPFICNASFKKKKLCPKCLGSNGLTEECKIFKEEKNDNNFSHFNVESLPREITGGIYKIEYKNIIYIGETFNFRKRWNVHMKDLQEGVHCNYLLRNYYNKNRPLTFKVIDTFIMKNFKKNWDAFKPYIKLINLIKENNLIKESMKCGRKVANIERTYETIMTVPCIMEMIQFLDENKILEYDDLLKIPVNKLPKIDWKQMNKILKNRQY